MGEGYEERIGTRLVIRLKQARLSLVLCGTIRIYPAAILNSFEKAAVRV